MHTGNSVHISIHSPPHHAPSSQLAFSFKISTIKAQADVQWSCNKKLQCHWQLMPYFSILHPAVHHFVPVVHHLHLVWGLSYFPPCMDFGTTDLHVKDITTETPIYNLSVQTGRSNFHSSGSQWIVHWGCHGAWMIAGTSWVHATPYSPTLL